MSPLSVLASNPRYFSLDGETAIYLTGSHTWANLQDIGLIDTPPFPYQEYLDFMQASNHNFMRLWMFEQPERACWTELDHLFRPAALGAHRVLVRRPTASPNSICLPGMRLISSACASASSRRERQASTAR